MRVENTRLTADDIATMSREDHAQAFATFVAGLLSSYDRYLSVGEPDLVRDGVSYSMSALWLSDVEHARMLQDLAAVVAPHAEFGPSTERKRRLIATAFMPLANSTEKTEERDD